MPDFIKSLLRAWSPPCSAVSLTLSRDSSWKSRAQEEEDYRSWQVCWLAHLSSFLCFLGQMASSCRSDVWFILTRFSWGWSSCLLLHHNLEGSGEGHSSSYFRLWTYFLSRSLRQTLKWLLQTPNLGDKLTSILSCQLSVQSDRHNSVAWTRDQCHLRWPRLCGYMQYGVAM